MVDNAVRTPVPDTEIHDAVGSMSPPSAPAVTAEKNVLFDSIANDVTTASDNDEASSLKTVFAGLLWFGYAVAIVVALVLVWSAVSGLLQSMPR